MKVFSVIFILEYINAQVLQASYNTTYLKNGNSIFIPTPN